MQSTTAERFQSHVLPTYSRLPLEPVRGHGCRLEDNSGRVFLDFCMGIATCSLGHAHPRVAAAIAKQATTLLHTSNLYHIPVQAELAEEINTRHVMLDGRVFFGNSGAEANDGLIKLARRFGHHRPQADGSPRFEVLTFRQSFHGRTLGSMAATGQEKIQQGFDPLLPGFRHLPFNDASALAAAIRPETVAILVEPVQGEGGVNVATPEFLRAAAAICKENDLLLMFDEVQAGFGRCGESMAWRTIAPEILPDGISWAKGMGGGVPIGAFWASSRPINEAATALHSLMGPGSHGSTYGGNPLVCAASLEVLREIREASLAENATQLGTHIQQTVTAWDHPAVTNTRGLGLLVGIGLNTAAIHCRNASSAALELVLLTLKNGLLTVAAGPDTLRLLPPLNVTREEVDEALGILRISLDQAIQNS